jgi:hypothetical protein
MAFSVNSVVLIGYLYVKKKLNFAPHTKSASDAFKSNYERKT